MSEGHDPAGEGEPAVGEPGTAAEAAPEAAPGSGPGWQRWLPYAVYGMFALRVLIALVVARGWFFTNDDWDFLTREHWGDITDPHAGHLNVVAATWAYVVRGVVGLDYWPGYALLAALAWPLVGLAAWFVWRRMDVDRRWAAAGACLLMWLGTAAWIQFGHAGQGIAAAGMVVAIYLDQRPLSVRTAVPNVAVSLIAVFSSSTAGLAVLVRAGLGLIYRKWNAVVAAGAVAVVYVLSRMVFSSLGPGTFRVGLKGLTDVSATVRVTLEVIGVGARSFLPWPRSLAWLLGLAVIAAVLAVLWRARRSYFATALIGSAGAYFAVSLITRFLGRERKLTEVLDGDWGSITGPRFANLAIAFAIVAAVPMLSRARLRSRAAIGGLALSMAVVGVWSLVSTFGMWDRVADKSEHPQASWIAPIVELRAAGEPGYPTEWRKMHPSLSSFFTLESIDYLVEAGLADSLLASDIYRAGDVPDIGEAKARGRLRMNVRPDRRTDGGWEDLGKDRAPGCVLIEGSRKYPVEGTARFRLERVGGNDVTLRWTDSWGRGTVAVSEQYWRNGEGAVAVEIVGPENGAAGAHLIVESDAVEMCFD